MSGIYPGAQWRPLGPGGQRRLWNHDIICLHTMVGSLWGTDAYFRQGGYSGVDSHFGVGGDGYVLQWVDCDQESDANLYGNDRCITIETADHGPEFSDWSGWDVPAWTPAQCESISQIIAWACTVYRIPCVLIPDSLPGRRGIGYHRQGVDPYRVPGGEKWSNSYGKVCPGDRRIAQIPGIVARAHDILFPPAPPAPPPRRNDPMADVKIPVEDDLTFRATSMCEGGEASAVSAGAWITMGSTWGSTDFRVVCLAADGTPVFDNSFTCPNNEQRWMKVPDTAKMFTLEGSVENVDTIPAAALWTLAKVA